MANQSSISEFLLLEFSGFQELQIAHFCLFLILYLMTLTGNLLIISVVVFDYRLHTPMYFFLMNLAIQDIASVSVLIPNTMINYVLNNRYISYSGCVAQVLFFISFVGCDVALLTVMGYDRYVAICNPLQYELIMNRRACRQMIGSVWMAGFLYGVLHTGGTFATPLCSNVVNQFFCEIPQLLKLACSDLFLAEIGSLIFSALAVVSILIFIVATYIQIFSAVLRIPSVQGRKKALSTCLPHVIVFSVFVTIVTFAYLRSPPQKPSHLDLAITLTYSIIPPMLNPLIYSLRNKEIKNALSKLLHF
ncbi:olfactory receptor 14J1-like [Protobothrops mucrosquamatus]|uniref:olfactory receptor 14J1-like n=1 Tax=Protobothrops mucrosquamatus TaxID=103944 RepID=UPI000775EA36|nr:olfactory receptor 14J1-like [Protobothrops mucrosquamatus]